MDLLEHLVGLERRFWTAGANFYRTLLAEDCVMLFGGMGIMERKQAIDGIAESGRWEDVTMEEARVTVLGDDVAVLCYRGSARREGEDYTALVSSVYARRHGEWKLALHHQSPV
jgi:hypothetical protein